jgi:hypothetical protein
MLLAESERYLPELISKLETYEAGMMFQVSVQRGNDLSIGGACPAGGWGDDDGCEG